MPALTTDQLQALAMSGLTNAEITAQLGRAQAKDAFLAENSLRHSVEPCIIADEVGDAKS